MAAARELQVLLEVEAQPAAHWRPVPAWAPSAPAAPRRRGRHPDPVGTGPGSDWHWSFPDPSRATGTEAEQLAVYRAGRDAIRVRIEREVLPLVV